MSSRDYLRLVLKLRVKSDRSELLQGLDNWLSLGLITQEEVKDFCQANLTCSLPLAVSQTVLEVETEPVLAIASQPVVRSKPAIWRQIWQSFKAELSLRWLLLLGIFLVVVSSIVLAASVWQQFSPTKQYVLLFAYTLAFWGVGVWTSRISNLPLTSQTLQTIGLLLIPVNFWAMDALGLWIDFEGVMAMAIASLILTGIYIWQNRNRHSLSSSFNFLTLSYLHWGWSWLQFPLIAIYVGGIITFMVLKFLSPRSQIGVSFIVYAFLLILVRGIFGVEIPLEDLGLVIGVMGWLTGSQQLQQKIKRWSPIIGFTLLLIAVVVTLREPYLWQNLVILGLALALNFNYLRRYWQKRYVFAIFCLGLLAFWQLERLLLPQMITSTENLHLFAYLVIFLVFSDWLYRQNQGKIAVFAERLSLGLGVIVTLMTSYHPGARSLGLILSTIILIVLAYRRTPTSRFRVYFAHIIALITLLVNCAWLLPNLNPREWILILLGIAIAELFFSVTPWGIWSESGWGLGLTISFYTYILLFNQFLASSFSLVWLSIPLTLTGVVSIIQEESRSKKAQISCLALILAQLLAITSVETRLISFTVGTFLMVVNYRVLPNLQIAIIHWGLILGLGGSLISFLFEISHWWLPGAIAILGLWLIADYINNQSPNYAQAADIWGKFIGISLIIGLSFRTIFTYFNLLTPQWQVLGGIGIIIISLLNRDRRQTQPMLIYGVAWLIELALVEIILLAGGTILTLAIANVILGIVSLSLRGWLRSKNRYLVLIPLFYAMVGLVCRWGYFTPYTGLLTLGIALTGIGIGSQYREWKWIINLSMVGISWGVYESLFYFLLPLSPEEMGKELSIIIIGTTAIALVYRFSTRFTQEIKIFAHIHWAIATGLQILGIIFRLQTPWNILASLVLSTYALIEGRDLYNPRKNWWVYAGIIQLGIIISYLPSTWLKFSNLLNIVLACCVAWLIYQKSWESWGWQSRPWYRSASIIPVLTALISNPVSWNLLPVVLFYLYLSRRDHQIRWSYLSLAILNWAIARWLLTHNFSELIWYVSLVGLSLIYITFVDPWLKLPQQREQRHRLRLVGTGIIAIVSLWLYQETGIFPATLGIVSVFLGIALRIRAFLFVGTLTFTLTIFYQLIVLSVTYAFLKWIIGLLIGISLIGIAANFERSRGQIVIVWQQWLNQLEQWE